MRLPRIRPSLAVIVVAATMIPTPAPAQDAQAKGAQLLADARKAIGGDDKLRAVKTLQANGSFRRTAGNNTLDGDVEVQIEMPDKYRRNESVGLAGGPNVDRTEVLNGTDTWQETSGGGPGGGFGGGRGGFGGGDGGDRAGRGGFGGGGFGGARGRDPQAGDQGATAAGGRGQIDPARLQEAQRRMRQADFSRLMLVWLLTTDAPATWVGTAESPEGNADVREIKPADSDATRLFLDVSTHMPLMITWQGPAVRVAQGGRRGSGRGRGDAAQPQTDRPTPDAPRAQGPPPNATFAMHLSDYKAPNGIKLPFTITRSLNDQTLEEIC